MSKAMYNHWWSGWPGAWCMKCGAEHRLELAMAEGFYDAYANTWDTPEHEAEYAELPCPVSNAEYTARTGHVIPADQEANDEMELS